MQLQTKILSGLQAKLQRQQDAVLVTEAHITLLTIADDSQLSIPAPPAKTGK